MASLEGRYGGGGIKYGNDVLDAVPGTVSPQTWTVILEMIDCGPVDCGRMS